MCCSAQVDASGRLPQTFPRRLQDNPAYLNYPGENGKVLYGEGLFVGYRYYDKKEIAPLFPFGFGLSYTTFDYANLRLSAATGWRPPRRWRSAWISPTAGRGPGWRSCSSMSAIRSRADRGPRRS